MKHYIVKIFSIIAISFLTQSCDDYLTLEPQDNLIQNEFWKTKDHVKSALAGCYASMNSSDFTERVLYWGELRGELLVNSASSTAANNLINNFNTTSSTYSNWSAFYKTINHCNLVLEFAPGIQDLDSSFTDEELKRYTGEARAIRALCYFILVKTFKEVPLVIVATSTNDVPFYVAKSSEADVLEQVIDDLKYAVDNLPISYSESLRHDRGQINKGSALTILADVYLWAEQYDNCLEACNDVRNLNKYTLVPGINWFNDIFFEGNSSEGIFELQFSVFNSTYANTFDNLTPRFRPFADIDLLYTEFPNDVRGDNASYSVINNNVFKFAGKDPIATEYRTTSEFFNSFIFYRYSELLLIEAEAYILSPNEPNYLLAARDLMNLVHERATGEVLATPLTENDLLEELLKQRKKEFAFEGKRWFDLLRNDRRNDFQDHLILDMAETKTTLFNYDIIISNFSDPASYFLPILQNELDLNSNLEQNEFYIN